MDDHELADEIIARLNKLIEDPEVRKDIAYLIWLRIPEVQVSTSTRAHPTIQVTHEGFGFLGLLNGLVGADPTESWHRGWGYISAEFDDDHQLIRFLRTGVVGTSDA